MEQLDNNSLIAKLAGFMFFAVLAVASFAWFICSGYGTFHSFLENRDAVFFSKGAMYGLGSGLVALLLILFAGYQNVRKSKLSKSQERWMTRLLLLGFAVMFIFPLIAHWGVNSVAVQKGYFECSEMSYQWLLYKSVVYVNGQDVCTSLINSH